MSTITFADVVHQSISFSTTMESQAAVLALIDTPWVQRLRDISQTANTRLVYMFSEHSRFGHCLGVAYLADLLMGKLALSYPKEITKYRTAVTAAALLHDVGHLAPGSHTAYKTWFPTLHDAHEEISLKIIQNEDSLTSTLKRFGNDMPQTVASILAESKELPAWTWEIISGGGWNVDRGNWCIVDSVLAGVSYGKYNIPALTESIVITQDGHLSLNESRLDSMMHFAVSRHAMYRQLYHHRVILATDMINKAIVQRARDLGAKVPYADSYMRAALDAKSPFDLPLETIFFMRESWWRYHLLRWMTGDDKILADLSGRLINRKLFKTTRVHDNESFDELSTQAERLVKDSGFDPQYYLHSVSTTDMHAGDDAQSMQVLMDNGKVKPLGEAEPLFTAMIRESKNAKKTWLVLPEEAKKLMGRAR